MKKKYFQPFSQNFNFSTISPTFSLLIFFLKCIMKKIYFFSQPSIKTHLFHHHHLFLYSILFSTLCLFFLNTELQILFPTFSVFEKKVQKL